MLELYKCALVSGEGDGGGGCSGKWTLQKLPLVLNSEKENDDDEANDPRAMNFVYGCAYQFMGDGSDRLLVKVVPKKTNYWPTSPPEEPVSTGPSIQVVSKDARKAPGRTYQGK